MRSIPFIRSFLVVLILACVAASAAAQVSILITTAPPALPIYDQPICPGQVTSGRRVTGLTITATAIITGFRAHG